MAIALLVITICSGGMGFSRQGAIAASPPTDTPPSDAYDAGPIRQSRNPISNENFRGGIDLNRVEEKGRTTERQPESDKTLLDTLKEWVPGTSSDGSDAQGTSPRSRFEPERNPTLERYTEQGGMS